MRPDCPKCKTSNPKKSGHAVGRQRWKCKACGYEFTRLEKAGKSYHLKMQAVRLYESGMSSNRVGKALELSPTTVLSWARIFSPPEGRVYQLKPRLNRVFPPEVRRALRTLQWELQQVNREIARFGENR